VVVARLVAAGGVPVSALSDAARTLAERLTKADGILRQCECWDASATLYCAKMSLAKVEDDVAELVLAALSSAPDAPTCARCNRPMTPEEAEAFRCCASCWVALHSMGDAPTEPSGAAIHAAIGAAAAWFYRDESGQATAHEMLAAAYAVDFPRGVAPAAPFGSTVTDGKPHSDHGIGEDIPAAPEPECEALPDDLHERMLRDLWPLRHVTKESRDLCDAAMQRWATDLAAARLLRAALTVSRDAAEQEAVKLCAALEVATDAVGDCSCGGCAKARRNLALVTDALLSRLPVRATKEVDRG
jgi:hypothetical protein